ncbi:hypothetical protein IG631_24133 [Alternaria alternata]|nr:hypothetical protein IG631_24133 [Alternaria alternata]
MKRVALTAVGKESRESCVWKRRCVLAAYTPSARAPAARRCPRNKGKITSPRDGHISWSASFTKQKPTEQSVCASKYRHDVKLEVTRCSPYRMPQDGTKSF